MTPLALWLEHRHVAIRVSRRWHLPGADRDDVQQEALIALWVAATKHQPELGPFDRFASTVVFEHMWKRLRVAKSRRARVLTDALRFRDDPGDDHVNPDLFEPTEPLRTDELAETREELRRLVAAINRLSDSERAAVLASVNGDTVRAARSSTSVQNHLRRARMKLREAA